MNNNFPTRRSKSGGLVIEIGTHLDNNNASVLLDQLMTAIDKNQLPIYLDMKHCELLSSSGVGAIISNVEAARAMGSDITLLQPRETVLVILNTLGLTKMLSIQQTRLEEMEGVS